MKFAVAVDSPMSNLCRRSCCNCGWVAVSARCRCHLHISQLSNSCTLPADLLLLLRLYHGNFPLSVAVDSSQHRCCGASATLFPLRFQMPYFCSRFLPVAVVANALGVGGWYWSHCFWFESGAVRAEAIYSCVRLKVPWTGLCPLTFSSPGRQIRFKYGSALSGFSLKELITAWCLITVQSIVYSY